MSQEEDRGDLMAVFLFSRLVRALFNKLHICTYIPGEFELSAQFFLYMMSL